MKRESFRSSILKRNPGEVMGNCRSTGDWLELLNESSGGSLEGIPLKNPVKKNPANQILGVTLEKSRVGLGRKEDSIV